MLGLVTLTTDFGRRDAYAAALEAAVLNLAPDARVVHVSHEVPPGDIATGAYLLEYASHAFAEGAGRSPVHLGVVDPGVGSKRRMLAVDCGGFLLVGPDNGLLRRALRGRAATAVALPDAAADAAPTFQ
ncbi:MAG: SAM-dependent chlorinase/fluorinase, partial [Candidatus Dormibacteraeota bacterium]|nr:SAM-dependent chlorinase/fluorinase [Candidatus Dormibacteraeota bacterium]